jgi:hypothetical protein
MEVAWSKVGAVRRMLEDFPLLLLHDNARSHTANKTNETLRNFKWEVLLHPTYMVSRRIHRKHRFLYCCINSSAV